MIKDLYFYSPASGRKHRNTDT